MYVIENLLLRVDQRVDLLNENVSEAIVWTFFIILQKTVG